MYVFSRNNPIITNGTNGNPDNTVNNSNAPARNYINKDIPYNQGCLATKAKNCLDSGNNIPNQDMSLNSTQGNPDSGLSGIVSGFSYLEISPDRGVEAQFLIDTGAHVSIINFETFNAIKLIQLDLKLETLKQEIKAANGQRIPMLGVANINCSFDISNESPIIHKFWISEKNQCKSNLLGMDLINKHCKKIDFEDETLSLSEFEKIIKLQRNGNKAFPYFAKLFALRNTESYRIPSKTNRVIKFVKPKAVKFIPPKTTFKPLNTLYKCNTVIYDTYTTQPEETFPLQFANYQEHEISLPKGIIGYMTCDAIRKMDIPSSPSKEYKCEDMTVFLDVLSTYIQDFEVESVNNFEKDQGFYSENQSYLIASGYTSDECLVEQEPNKLNILFTETNFNPSNEELRPESINKPAEKIIKGKSLGKDTNNNPIEHLDNTQEMEPNINIMFEEMFDKDIHYIFEVKPREIKNMYRQHETLDAENETSLKPSQLIDEFINSQPETTAAVLRKFKLDKSDLTELEKVRLLRILSENIDVYSCHKYDVGKLRQPFNIPLQKDAKLRKQRPSKVPLQYRDKLNELLKELEENKIIREMGKENDTEMGTAFINPIIILPKGNLIKIVIDARYLNSITDLTTYSWPLEPLESLLNRLHGKYFSISDMSCAYHQVLLSEAAKKLVSFVIGDRQFCFDRGFYGLSGLPNFFSREMTKAFQPIIETKDALAYLDDLMMMADDKEKMFQIIIKFHHLMRKSGMKAAPDKTEYFLRKVKYLGHNISEFGISPVESRVKSIQALKSPEDKKGVMRVLGCFNFYSKYIKNLYVNCKPFYTLIRTDTEFKWTAEHEKILQQIKAELTSDTVLAIPDPKYPFFIHCDSSNVGIGCILVQQFPKEKRIVSYNSRIFSDAEQKMSTQIRELTGIVYALTIYTHLIIGSLHPIYVFCDHKPILYLWAKKSLLSHRFFRYQQTFAQFTNLRIVWTPGTNLAFPDLLSRNFTDVELTGEQLKHKKLPKELIFLDGHGQEICYSIEHSNEMLKEREIEDKADSVFDTYPILCEQNNKKLKLQMLGKVNTVVTKEINEICTTDFTEIYTIVKEKANNKKNKKITFKEILNFKDEIDSENEKLLKNKKESKEVTPIEKNRFKNDHLCNDHANCYDAYLNKSQKDEKIELTELLDNDYLSPPNFIEEMIEAKRLTILMAQLNEECKLSSTVNSTFIDNYPTFLHDKAVEIVDKEINSKTLFKEMENGRIIDITNELILSEQKQDIVLKEVRKWVLDKKLPDNVKRLPNTVLKYYANDFVNLKIHEQTKILCKFEYLGEIEEGGKKEGDYKICIPLSLIIPVFYQTHSGKLQGHMGITKTLMQIKNTFSFPGLYKWVRALIQDCLPCQMQKGKNKQQNTAPLMSPMRQVPEPMHTIHIDYKGPLNPSSNGKSYVLVIVDAFSKFIYSEATKEATANATIEVVQHYINLYGIPKFITCDRGTHFVNKDFVYWTENLGIVIKFLSGYNPWSNGMVENYNQHLQRYIRTFTLEHPNVWSKLISQWNFAQNTSYITGYGLTAHEIMFGQKPNVPLTLKLGIIRDEDKNCIQHENLFCSGLDDHSHFDLDKLSDTAKELVKGPISENILKREHTFSTIYRKVYTRSKMDQPDVYANRNLTKKGKSFQKDQLVLVENKEIIQGIGSKMLPKRKGPFRIINKINPTTYKLLCLNTGKILVRHRNLLILYTTKHESIPKMMKHYQQLNREQGTPTETFNIPDYRNDNFLNDNPTVYEPERGGDRLIHLPPPTTPRTTSGTPESALDEDVELRRSLRLARDPIEVPALVETGTPESRPTRDSGFASGGSFLDDNPPELPDFQPDITPSRLIEGQSFKDILSKDCHIPLERIKLPPTQPTIVDTPIKPVEINKKMEENLQRFRSTSQPKLPLEFGHKDNSPKPIVPPRTMTTRSRSTNEQPSTSRQDSDLTEIIEYPKGHTPTNVTYDPRSNLPINLPEGSRRQIYDPKFKELFYDPTTVPEGESRYYLKDRPKPISYKPPDEIAVRKKSPPKSESDSTKTQAGSQNTQPESSNYGLRPRKQPVSLPEPGKKKKKPLFNKHIEYEEQFYYPY